MPQTKWAVRLVIAYGLLKDSIFGVPWVDSSCTFDFSYIIMGEGENTDYST